ncbi:MAG: sensor histidine kinase [Gammaproteobacteria bacterium]|nr:sensor histidine kinase [Gammaproteobacteria bacterium]
MYAVFTGVSFLVLFGVIFWSTTRFMRHQIDDSVRSELDEIISDSRESQPEAIEALVQGLSRHSSGFYYLMQDARGDVRAGNLPALDPKIGIREWGMIPRSAGSPLPAMRGRGVMVAGEYLFVGWSTHQLHEMEEMVIGSFFWGLAASVALALAGGVVTSGRLMRKIEAVSQTSRDIIEGDLARRVPMTSAGDEFDNLAGSINAMLDRIETLMNDLRQVTTDIAHDMRTPLTRLRQRLELAQRSSVDGDALRDTLAVTVRDIDAILGIFAALLRIAQIDSGARKSAFKNLNLSELLYTVVELYRPAAEDKLQSFQDDIAPDLAIRGDHEMLMQLFANLIENAVRHAPQGAKIALIARNSGGWVDVVISDDGPGIPAELRGKVLQRFYRLENSRTTPGNGLGLSLAAAIVKLHEAALTLSDGNPGLCVKVSLHEVGNAAA